jgi:hypothetical protein
MRPASPCPDPPLPRSCEHASQGAEMGYAPSSTAAPDPLAFKSFDAGEAGALGSSAGQQQASGVGRAAGANGSGSGGGAALAAPAPTLWV